MNLSPYKYCPVCAANLVLKKLDPENDPRMVCEECSYVFYMNSKPTTNAVIMRDGKLLLTKRGIEPAKGKWDFAGGFLENGEDPVEGLVREIKEELGLDCSVGNFVAAHVSCFHEYYRECALNMYYFVDLAEGEIQAMSDVAAAEWFSLDEIVEEQMSYDGAWKVVEHVKLL